MTYGKHGRVEVEIDPDDADELAISVDGRYYEGWPIELANDLYLAPKGYLND